MSNSENVCVGCKHPIVDETIEGDMTLRVGTIYVYFKDLATGVDSKCRNCAVVLDAIVAHVGGEDRLLTQSIIWVDSSPICQELRIGIGTSPAIAVLRHSGMSEHSIAMLELRVHKIFHAVLSLPSPMSGTSESLDRFRKTLLRKRLFVRFKGGRLIACNTMSIVCND